MTSEFEGGAAPVNLSEKELVILNNALNEVLNGIEVFEFSTRLGCEPDEALTLMNRIGAVLERLTEPRD